MARKKKIYRTMGNPGSQHTTAELFIGKKSFPIIFYRVDRFTIPYKHKNEWLDMNFSHFVN